MKKINKILIIILILTTTSLLGIYYFKYIQLNGELEVIKKNIEDGQLKIKTLNGMKSLESKPSQKDIEIIKERFEYNEYIFGASLYEVEIEEKITKKGLSFNYFKLKIKYTAEDLDSVKSLIVTLYLDPKVYRITNIDKNNIYLTIREPK